MPTTWDTGPYGRPTCLSEKATLDLPAATPSKAQPTSVAMPWSWKVSLLPQPQRPIASALLEQLRTVAIEVKKSQIEDTVGSSWAALAMEEDPQERRIGTLLVQAGAGGGGGRGRGEGGGRAGILNSENNGRNRWQPSLIGRTS